MSVTIDLTGKTALVTGAATGIGAAIARALAEAGADIATTVNRRPADVLRADLEKVGRRLLEVPLNLSELTAEAAQNTLDEVQAELGACDILVNNAGIIRRAPAAETDWADWKAVIDINLHACWLLSQAVADRMLKEKRNGRIIQIASLLSFQGGITVPAYAASKHAVVGMMRAQANEWAGSGINVNAIAPGYIKTEATKALQQDAERNVAILGRIPANRWGEPEDIGGMAVFLASDLSTYVHGQVIAVDGGWMAR